MMINLKKIVAVLLAVSILIPLLPQVNVDALATEPKLQVKLRNFLDNKSSIVIVPSVEYTTNLTNVKLAANVQYNLKLNNDKIVILKGTTEVGRTATFNVAPIKATGFLEVEKRPYLGSFSFIIEDNKYIRPINMIAMEDYLKGVVPAEMPALWPMEALKAQTISARTYASGYIGKVINDTQSFQVYGGYAWHERTTKAVNETHGQILTYGGNTIGSGALFSSSNGGKTESNSNAWGNASVPYLTIKEDPYDPKTSWSFTFKKIQIDTTDLDFFQADSWWKNVKEADQTAVMANIKKWIGENGYAGKDFKIAAIPQLSLYEKTSGGRVSKGSITVDFLVKEDASVLLKRIELRDTTAGKIRSIIGLNIMKSHLVNSIDTATDSIIVSGAGYGHGVGLSQYGAKKAAEAGKSYKEILSFYYDKTNLTTLYQAPKEEVKPVVSAPSVPVTVPAEHKPAPVKDIKAPTIKSIRTTYDKKKQQVKIQFSINEKAKVRVYIKDKKGKIISYPLKKKLKSAGRHTIVWNASKLNDGKYKIVVSVEDLSKNSRWTAVSYNLKKPVVTGKVKATKLNIRSKASISSKILGTVKKNSKVTILHKTGSWYKIKYGKVTGYVSARYLTVLK
jgi:stage II sporulation protein D